MAQTKKDGVVIGVRPLSDAELDRLRGRPMLPDGLKARLIATIDALKKQLGELT